MVSARFPLLGLSATLLLAQTPAPDLRGSSDHPLISRYPGSVIREYRQVDFDEYALPAAVESRKPAKPKMLQGKVTKIYYQNPKGRSTLEIYGNFSQALKGAGFKDLFTCQAEACGIGYQWRNFNGTIVSGTGDVLRYVAAHKPQPSGDVYVGVMVSPNGTSLHVIETKPMEAGLVTVNAQALAESIERDGFVSVYAIYFDTGKADLKPESDAAIEQIGKLLGSRPQLKLHVVGHTDNVGGLPMNLKLSADRAASVVGALTGKHSVAASRLAAHGVGPLAPVVTNTAEEGRAKNRRVDLVAQ